jgi:hypothetical protein
MRKGRKRILLDVAGLCLSAFLRPSLMCARVYDWTGCTNTFKDEARRRRMGDVLRRVRFITVTGYKPFSALKVPRQCPLVLLVKSCWKQSRSLGSEEDSVVEVGFWECAAEGKKVAHWSWILCLRDSIMKKFCSRGEGSVFWRKFWSQCWRRLHGKNAFGSGFWYQHSMWSRTEKGSWKNSPIGRSQDWLLASSPTSKCKKPNFSPYLGSNFIFNKYTDVFYKTFPI